MARSLWVGPVSEADREEKRQALQRIIEATVGGNDAGVHYYQGLHDIASVLLLVSESEALASRMLSQLAVCHLKDCTRPSLDATTEVLSMLYPILREADPELHAFLAALGAPALEEPHWALSWYMTWFAHEVQDLSQIARLFDFFIASHPLMPLYAAAVAVRAHRENILARGAEEGGDAVYATLRRLSVLGPGSLSADELAQQAAALYQRLRPHMLLRQWGLALKHATTLDAYLHEGRWKVPEFPPKRRKQGMQRFKRGHQSPRLRPPAPPLLPPPQQQQAAVVVALFTGLAGFAFLLAQMQALGIVPPAIP
jgi:TBC1 domain family member 20